MPIMPELPESAKTNIATYVLEGRLKPCGYLRIDVEIPAHRLIPRHLAHPQLFSPFSVLFNTKTLTPAASDGTVGDSPCQR
jgi:hypothetical protein